MGRLTAHNLNGDAFLIKKPKVDVRTVISSATDKLAYYEDLTEQGEILILSTGLNSTVYFIDPDDPQEIVSGIVDGFYAGTDDPAYEYHVFYRNKSGCHNVTFDDSDFNDHNIYLTREEAEGELNRKRRRTNEQIDET